jgi:hypothetical protein
MSFALCSGNARMRWAIIASNSAPRDNDRMASPSWLMF